MAKATSVIDVILGEAAGALQKATPEERFQDMLGIASVIDNRSTRTNTPAEDVVAAKDKYNDPQFDAYGNKLPSGVEAYRDLAEKAWDQVQTVGPIHDAVFYGAPGAKLGIDGLVTVGQTKGHVFYDDPQNRNILVGDNRYAKPSEERFAVPQTQVANVPGLNVPAIPANAYAPDITNPAQFAFGDILAPTPVQTSSIAPPEVALPSIAPTPTPAPEAPSTRSTGGLGLAALAPNGLIGRGVDTSSILPSRPEAPDISLLNTVDAAVKSVFGPDYSISVSSGTYNDSKQAALAAKTAELEARGIDPYSKQGKAELAPLGQYGSPRHNQGIAADFSIYNTVTGQHVTRNNTNANTFRTFEQEAAARGVTGIGFGRGYMDRDGTARYHMDFERDSTWAADKALTAEAKAFGRELGPLPSYDTHPQGLPTPTSREIGLSLQTQADAYGQLAAGLGAAGTNLAGTTQGIAPDVGQVDRTALADIPSVPEAVLNDYAQTVAPAGFDFSVPTTPTQVASLAPAPVDSVERSSLPSLAPAPAVPSTTDMANAYGQLASTMTQAGVTGLGAMPSTPSVPSATTFASLPNTLTAPANTFQSTTPAPVATSVPTVPSTPAAPAVTAPSINTAPAVPTPASAPKSESPSLGSRLGHAAIGGAIGGLPGAVIGGLFGPAITSTTKDVLGGIGKGLGLNTNATPSTSSKSTGTGLGGFLGGLGDVFSGQSNITMPESTYSVGRGLDAIDGVFSGAFGPGATAISLGNPNVSFVDLGNGNVAKVNSELGTTSLVNASSFNWSGGTQGGGKSNSASSWGLGDVFGGLGDAVSDAFSGWGGDASASSYSGPNSTTDPSDSW